MHLENRIRQTSSDAADSVHCGSRTCAPTAETTHSAEEDAVYKKHFTMKEGDPFDEGLVLKAADFTVPVGVEGEKKQIGFCS